MNSLMSTLTTFLNCAPVCVISVAPFSSGGLVGAYLSRQLNRQTYPTERGMHTCNYDAITDRRRARYSRE